MRKGRSLKVRFAPPGAAIKVKNLTPWVTNELLEKAFSVFGDVSFYLILVFNSIRLSSCVISRLFNLRLI